MKISVIVPVYNIAQDLPRCLDSILAQTHDDLEIIVVDDGSTDSSRQVIDSYASKDARIKPVFKKNGGVTSARLQGIGCATGDWIGFVDGDDKIDPDMYERLLSNALKYQASISHCGYKMVFSDDRVHYFHNSGCIKEQDSVTAVRDLLEGTLVEPGLCNKLYRKELFAGLADRMDSNIRINEDLLMNYYLFCASEKSIFEDWCPYHYIVRATSASRSKLNDHKIHDPIRVKELILADVAEGLKDDAHKALLTTCVYVYCGLSLDKDSCAKHAKDVLQRKIKGIYSYCALLPKRTGLLATLIVYSPQLFDWIYPLYVRFFQKNKYT